MYNFCFHGVRRRFRAILARFSLSVFLSLYNSYILIQTLIITPLRNVMLTVTRELGLPVVNIAKFMYTLFEYKKKYQEEVGKIKSTLFQAIADLYTLRKSEKNYHTKRHYIEPKKALRRRLVCV